MPSFHCNCKMGEFCGACSRFGYQAPVKKPTIIRPWSYVIDWEFWGIVMVITGIFLPQLILAIVTLFHL